ncbi:MAG: hypothetical protein M3535_02310 [Actinomycetota bacterium]|nr:hypothetical protein [Actinomycetota bacterium]
MMVMAAIAVVVAMGAAALSVDIGALASRKRDVRKVSDLASLDAVQLLYDDWSLNLDAFYLDLDREPLDGVVLPSEAVQSAAERTAGRNGFTVNGPDPKIALVARMGVLDAASEFQPCSDPEILLGPLGCEPDAVQVSVTDLAPRFFAFSAEDTYVTATSVAQIRQTGRAGTPGTPGTPAIPGTPGTPPGSPVVTKLAGLRIGSFLARLDSSQSPLLNKLLGSMLNGNVALDAVSYQGLADTTVGLDDLAMALNLGSVDEMASTDVTIGQLIAATADALDSESGPSTARATTALASLEAVATNSTVVNLGELMGIEQGQPGAAAAARFNVYDLILAGAEAANRNNVLSFNLDSASLPVAIQAATVRFALVESPREALGPPGITVSTAQLRMLVDLTLAQTVPITGALGVNLGQATVRLPVAIDAGQASAIVTSMSCSDTDGLSQATRVDVNVTTNVLRAAIGSASAEALLAPDFTGALSPARVVDVAGLVSATAESSTVLPGTGPGGVSMAYQPVYDDENTKTIGGQDPAAVGSPLPVDLAAPLRGDLSLGVNLLGIGVSASFQTDLLNTINAALGPANQLIDDLASGLGVKLGGADVTVFHGTCNQTPGTAATPGTPDVPEVPEVPGTPPTGSGVDQRIPVLVR